MTDNTILFILESGKPVTLYKIIRIYTELILTLGRDEFVRTTPALAVSLEGTD